MSAQQARQASADPGPAQVAPERGGPPESVVGVGWKVPLEYRGLPTVRQVVTRSGAVEAQVRFVVPPTPAWCTGGPV